MKQPISIQTADGTKLNGFLFSTPNPRGAVLLVPAMGVSQDFYASLAAWLQGEGHVVLTFDFRGIGRSKQGSLKDEKADVLTWAKCDATAALDELRRWVPEVPIYWLGHSLGGQIFAMSSHRTGVEKMITITSGSGYWLENSSQLRRKVWWLWYFVVPVTISIFGYFPGKRLKMVGDLPAGVMRQWRKWCLNREYAIGVEGEWLRKAYASVRTPITSISFTDDELMSEKNIRSLHQFYSNAPQKEIRLKPSDVNLSRIGHFGFFRDSMKDVLWKKEIGRAHV